MEDTGLHWLGAVPLEVLDKLNTPGQRLLRAALAD